MESVCTTNAVSYSLDDGFLTFLSEQVVDSSEKIVTLLSKELSDRLNCIEFALLMITFVFKSFHRFEFLHQK